MRKIVLLLITACLLAAGVTQAAPAEQQAAPQPQITSFTSSTSTVDRTALNNRTARVPVSWTTSNRPNSANLVFEQLLPDGRVVNVELPRDNPWVASNGDGVAAPFPPGGNATTIQLRLRLIDVAKLTVWSEKTLTLNIGDVTSVTPTIASFSSSATAVLRSDLTNKTARVPVSWQVNDRPNSANLVFEQVLTNGSVVNVELPRQNPWVASSGNGIAAAVAPGDNAAATITVRLRVIDVASQKTLTQKDITVPVTDVGPKPTLTVFTSTTGSVSRAALVGKTARVPVTWALVNRPNNSNLVFEQVLDNGTVVNVELPRQNPYVSSEGNGMAAPVNPGSSAVVKLQVRLIDLTTQATLAQRDLTVNISEGGNVPKIAFFNTTTSVVDLATLTNKTARIPVAWSVDNRPNGTNLVFEQVLGNNTTVNVELPRQNPYVSSSGQGVTAPVAPGGTMTVVQLRLRLINLSDSTTIDSKDITIPINGLTSPATYTKVTDCYGTGFPAAPGIAIGGQARVVSSVSTLNVYTSPVGGQTAGTLAALDTFSVLEGPECYTITQTGVNTLTVRYWRVNSAAKNLTGWVAEYNQSTTGTTSAFIEVANGGPINPPVINSFTVNPTTAKPGDVVTLAWQVTNAVSISLSPLPASINKAVANQMTGTTQLSIPITSTGTITVELIAANAAGQETRATVSITISGAAACQFSTSLTDDCPLSQETVSVVYQPFEKGYMVWNSNTKKIYVLFQDKTWQEFTDTWQAGEADPIAPADMPANMVMPIHGFGKVWTQLGGASLLGYATAAESAYSATWETHSMADGGQSVPTPHFTLPDGRVAHLSGQWTIS